MKLFSPVENHWKLANKRGRLGSLDCFVFIQGGRAEAPASLGISRKRLPEKVPNYPGSCLPTAERLSASSPSELTWSYLSVLCRLLMLSLFQEWRFYFLFPEWSLDPASCDCPTANLSTQHRASHKCSLNALRIFRSSRFLQRLYTWAKGKCWVHTKTVPQ